MIDLDQEELLDALDAVTWYNGLAEKILEWKKPGVVDYNPRDGLHYFGDKLDAWFNQLAPADKHQIQLFWMIGVYLFGNYGTSPRYGWIEAWEDFCEFIDRVTATYHEDQGDNDPPECRDAIKAGR